MLGELLEMLADGLGTTSTNRSRSKSSCRHCGKIINDEKAVTVLDLEAHYANCNGRNDKI